MLTKHFIKEPFRVSHGGSLGTSQSLDSNPTEKRWYDQAQKPLKVDVWKQVCKEVWDKILF